MCRIYYHSWPTCRHAQFGNSSVICEQGLLRIEYMRQHITAGLGIPHLDRINCAGAALINLGPPSYHCPRCVAAQPITVDAVEARLRDVSGSSASQPAQQALTWQSVEARLRTVSGPTNIQPTPQAPTWQEAQAEIYLREERAFALLDDEYDRIMADLHLKEMQAQRIQEAEEQSSPRLARILAQQNQLNGLSFTPQIAEHGSFIQGAGRWIPDRRPISQRYRDEVRERRHRPSTLSQVVIPEEEDESSDEDDEDIR